MCNIHGSGTDSRGVVNSATRMVCSLQVTTSQSELAARHTVAEKSRATLCNEKSAVEALICCGVLKLHNQPNNCFSIILGPPPMCCGWLWRRTKQPLIPMYISHTFVWYSLYLKLYCLFYLVRTTLTNIDDSRFVLKKDL
uniref:Uncharacterized protein n=1 Tax=Setaria viridis TaxID=4556 RepID=A0A4U6UY16_SETVI|nr:hypothetical protein SEVIR_4G073003v2 [Setaria viridis]